MPLIIQQGPLPNDGENVDPATFLEAWINGSVITGLDGSNFDTGEGGLSFVVSQTDAPASSTRTPGLFWFKRGEGRLYVWDPLDAPSALTLATDAARYRQGHDWISLSRGKQNWCIASKDIPQGALCYMTHSTLEGILTTHSESFWSFRADEQPGRGGHAPLVGRMYWFVTDQPAIESGTAFVTEITFIALESAASGTIFPAQEFGWCDMLASSGSTGSASYAFVTDSGVSESSFLQPGAWQTQSTNPGRMFVATFTDSSATSPTDVWLRSGFKLHFAPWGIARERV